MLRDAKDIKDWNDSQDLLRKELTQLICKYNSLFGLTEAYPEIVYNSLKRFLKGSPARVGTLKKYYRILRKEGLCKNH